MDSEKYEKRLYQMYIDRIMYEEPLDKEGMRRILAWCVEVLSIFNGRVK